MTKTTETKNKKSNVVNINNKDYDMDTFDAKQKYLIAQIRDLDNKIGMAKFQLDQHETAKTQFVNLLIIAVETEKKDETNGKATEDAKVVETKKAS